MYFIPLSQLESVELVIHSLRAAAGYADCSMCPAYKVCTKQCLGIANAVGQMLEQGSLPQFGEGIPVDQAGTDTDQADAAKSKKPGAGGKGQLKIVK